MTSPTLTPDMFEPPDDYAPSPTETPVEVELLQSESEHGLLNKTSTDNARAPAPPRTTVKLTPACEEPYVAGQCTVTLTLTLPPNDAPIFVGARSHDAAPLLETLARDQLPECLRALVERHYTRLPELSAQAEAEKAKTARRPKATTTAKPPSAKSATAPKKSKTEPNAPAPIPQADLFAELDRRATAHDPDTSTSTS